MSEIFENAITSLSLGIEDFKTGTDRRMLSAARNYYAGLLLLAKECLVSAAPNADAMEIIGAKFKPVPDGDAGVAYDVTGHETVDLSQLKSRFKDFGLRWPNVNIKKLQQFRNNLEHFHLKEPTSALREAIAASFPMILDLFKILKEDPQEHLEDVWETIIAERAAFDKVQATCLTSLKTIEWPAPVKQLDIMSCPSCHSSLIGQANTDNTEYEAIEGKCYQCGQEIDRETLMEMVVQASYEIEAYIAVKEGSNSPIAICPHCWTDAYVNYGETNACFSCGESVRGECARCQAMIDVNEYNSDYPGLCSYCAHMAEKVMRE